MQKKKVLLVITESIKFLFFSFCPLLCNKLSIFVVEDWHFIILARLLADKIEKKKEIIYSNDYFF
jgi:hypothetical protein